MTGRGPRSARLAPTYDVDSLRRDLSVFAEDEWLRRAPGTPWQVIVLRSRGGDPKDTSAGDGPTRGAPYGDTPNLARCPYIWSLLCDFEAPLRSVRLSRLDAGKRIGEHADPEVRLERGCPVRLHVPITEGDADLYIGGEVMRWGPGQLWYGDFAQRHSAHNFGPGPRVHLLVVAVVTDWLLSLFPEGSLA